MGADAVVGVDLRTGEHDWAENAIEYVVDRHGDPPRGAAKPGGTQPGGAQSGGNGPTAGSGPRRRGAPVLTELSVADYAKLLSAGVEPLGVVAWSSVFFVGASYSTQMMSGVGGMGFTQNQELPRIHPGRVQRARERGRAPDRTRRQSSTPAA